MGKRITITNKTNQEAKAENLLLSMQKIAHLRLRHILQNLWEITPVRPHRIKRQCSSTRRYKEDRCLRNGHKEQLPDGDFGYSYYPYTWKQQI